jgi:hypothetical protein
MSDRSDVEVKIYQFVREGHRLEGRKVTKAVLKRQKKALAAARCFYTMVESEICILRQYAKVEVAP